MLSDGRGAGLKVKLRALAMWKEQAIDTADAYKQMGVSEDPRDYKKACYVLDNLGITSVRLLTNNPRKITGISARGFDVFREPLEITVPNDTDAFDYLQTKATKLGHWLKQFGA